jgi:Tol biopolymer transport system component
MRTLSAAITLSVLSLLPGVPTYAAADQPSTAGAVVWTARAADGSESLRISDAAGTAEHALTHAAPGEKHIGAQFSPNGRWIAYEVDRGSSSEVRLIRPDGTDDHRLPLGCKSPCLGVEGPTWAGRRTLFVTRVIGPVRSGHPAESLLWAVRIDGSSKVRTSLATAAGKYEDSYAHLSRGGFFVTWTRVRVADGKSTIVRVDSDGDDERALLPWGLGVEANDVSLARSGPTRDLVIFESNGRGRAGATFVDIGTMPLGCNSMRECGRKVVWLTDNRATGKRAANPQWSPDGLDYVFNLRSGAASLHADIWTASFATGERRMLTDSTRFAYRPDWGPA